MSDKLEPVLNNTTKVNESSKMRVLHHAEIINQKKSDKQNIEQIINDLNKNKQWLINQPVEALIGLIGEASEIWEQPDFELET